MRTVLQVPMDKSFRHQVDSLADEMGFSSPQELIRVILHKLLKKELVINIEKTLTLSEKSNQSYQTMVKDYQQGKNFLEASSLEELMQQLQHED